MTEDFKRASRAVWEAMAPAWDEQYAHFEQTARPVTERMVERLAPAPGQSILDVAAGAGVAGLAAAALVGAEGRVLLTDFSAAMVAAARRRAAALGLGQVEARVVDAERMDLPDDAFDGVLCRWGYMLMGDPVAALAETRRVLRPGGRVAFAVFGAPEENPFAALPARVLRERGHLPPPEAGAPGILALGDEARLRDVLAVGGFPDVRLEDVRFTWRFAAPADFWGFLTGAAGALAMVLARLDPGEREAVRAEILEQVTPYRTAGGLELPALSIVGTAS